MKIRPFIAGDEQAIADLIVPIQREEFGIDISYADQPDLAEIKDFYQHGTGGFWLACYGDQVVGSIALLDMGGGQAALRKMFVHALYRGGEKGVAKRLLDHLILSAKQAGVKQIFLGTTDAFQAAHRFYEKNGFQLVPEEQLPETFLKMAVDSRFYMLAL